MRITPKKDRSRLIKAALGEIACDLSVENIQLVNMFTGEVYPAAVDVLDGFVVRVRTEGEAAATPAAQVHDGKGAYLVPGFVDTHMHVESTMMIPENLSRAIVPWGTTTVCTDPHEIGNVMGVDGVKFMLENGRKSALRHYVLAPSSVPAVPAVESTGAEFGAGEVGEILDMPDVVGIAEIMDFIGVVGDSPRMHSIIDEGLKRDMYLQGHAPTLSGAQLAAYRLGGPVSDHESNSAAEVAEKLRMGIHVNLRASSLVDILPTLVAGFRSHPWRDFVSVCTDDVHAADLLGKGHINWVVKKVVDEGIDPVEAYKFATLNAAREYGFDDMGAIAPGYLADMQLLRKLDGGKPEAVFIGGRLVAEKGEYLGGDAPDGVITMPNTVNMPHITSADSFRLKAPEGAGDVLWVRCIVPDPQNRIFRGNAWVPLAVKDGYAVLDGLEGDYQFISVVNRFGKPSQSLALLKDFGLKKGAFASTVAHDSHNFTVVFKNPADAYLAAQELSRCGGGITVVADGEVLSTLELPVAGLMSTAPCAQVSAAIDATQAAVETVCPPGTSLLATAIMSLPVFPCTIITDQGLMDGATQQFMDTVRTTAP